MPDGNLQSKLRAWCRLLRLPNLLTVPGDPLAGAMLVVLATGALNWAMAAALAAVSSVLIYAAGLILNDLCDLSEDRRDRPRRPLPSGKVGLRAALAAGLMLAVLGVAAAYLASPVAGLLAWALVAAVIVYDAGGKRVGGWGPLNMGLCRGLSLLLGAAAVAGEHIASPPVIVAAGGLTLYVAAVTLIAAGETRPRRFRFIHMLPAAALLATSPILILLVGDELASLEPAWLAFAPPTAALALSIICALATAQALRGRREAPEIQRAIGGLLRGLMIFQAGLAAMLPLTGWYVAAALLAAVPLNAFLARRFSPS